MDHIVSMFEPRREARLRYKDGEYRILSAGQFVRCAVTGKPIAIEDLRYWSVDRQEAYIDASASLSSHQQVLAEAEARRR